MLFQFCIADNGVETVDPLLFKATNDAVEI